MPQSLSRESRFMDAQCLSLLLDIELACAFIIRFSTVPPSRGLQDGVQPPGALDGVLQRMAVALAKLSRTANGACNLLSRAELDTIKVLAGRGRRTAAHDAARRVLLAAVPRLMFETQALLSKNREPWHPDTAQRSGATRLRAFPVVRVRASHT